MPVPTSLTDEEIDSSERSRRITERSAGRNRGRRRNRGRGNRNRNLIERGREGLGRLIRRLGR